MGSLILNGPAVIEEFTTDAFLDIHPEGCRTFQPQNFQPQPSTQDFQPHTFQPGTIQP